MHNCIDKPTGHECACDKGYKLVGKYNCEGKMKNAILIYKLTIAVILKSINSKTFIAGNTF